MIFKTGCFMTCRESNKCLLKLFKGLSAGCSTNEPKITYQAYLKGIFFKKQRTSQFAIQKY